MAAHTETKTQLKQVREPTYVALFSSPGGGMKTLLGEILELPPAINRGIPHQQLSVQLMPCDLK